MKKVTHKQAFTLIEVLVVVLIIAILAAVAVPQYRLAVAKSHLANAKALLASIKRAEEVYYLANGTYAQDVRLLDIDAANCSRSTDYDGVFTCDKHFMISLLSGDGIGPSNANLRAAYCPEEIETKNKWNSCAYVTGHYTYTVWLKHSSFPNKVLCQGILTDLGEKVCENAVP